MKKFLVLLVLLALPSMGFAEDKVLSMSTTTSTQSSGLLDVLLPEFKKDTGIDVKVMAKGTGAAIRDGVDGNVDVIFVHDPAREEKFVADGFGTKRYYVMYNDFLLIGPAADPAGAKSADAAQAMKKIAMSEAVFVSRGDDSGTHAKEQELWKASGLPLKEEDTIFKAKDKEVTFKAVRP
jgi:tungstate transport system substrate-binding protein